MKKILSGLSDLRKVWIIDIDGVIFPHNGHLDGRDKPLPGVLSFFKGISKEDYIIIVTGRKDRRYRS